MGKDSTDNAVYITYPIIKEGSTGQLVDQLQIFLSRYGSKVKVSGIFNSGTRNAVIAFQKKQGLDPTGIVEKQTWSKLLELVCNIG